MATQATLKQVQEIYIGLLGRAADLEGLNYWAGEITDGKITIEQVRANIVNEQAEYAANLGAISSRAILVATLYQNMFNRAPDSEGLEYWVNGDGKTVNADQLVLALSNGASAVDRLALDNRADVANFYTTNATFNVSSAAAVLLNVNSTLASVTTAKASISSDAESPAVAGQTFTLTANTNFITGTSGNDTFSGSAGTIDGHILNGGAGDDRLNLTVTFADDNNSAFTSQNIETISIRSVVGAAPGVINLEMGDVSGLETLEFRRIGEDITIANLQSLDTEIKMSSISTAENVVINFDASEVSGTSDTANVTVDRSTGGANLDINGVETIAITAVGEDNDLNIDGDDLETVTVAGAGDLNMDVDASVETVDASLNTGGVTVNFTAAQDVTVTGGSGDDTFAFGAGLYNEDDVVDGGDGVDTLRVTAFATTAGETYSSDNIEVLRLTSASVTMEIDQFSSDFTTVRVDAAGAHTLTLNDVDNDTVVLLTNGTAGTDETLTALNVTLASDTGADDVANITLTADGDDDGVDLTLGTLGVTAVETVNLTLNATSEGSIAVGAITENAIETLNVSGAADAELGSVAALTIETIDASNATGDIEFNLGAGDHDVTGGSGDDTFTFAGTFGTADTVDGGDGDDTLNVTLAAGTAAATVTNVESANLRFDVAGSTFSGANVSADLTSIEIDAASVEAVNLVNLKAAVASVRLGATAALAAGDAATIRYANGSDSAHTVLIGDSTAVPAADVDVGALTIVGNAGALTITSDNFTGNSVDSIAANTTEALTIVSEEDLTVTTTLNATSALSATFTSDGGNMTITGAQDLSEATSIVIDAADGNITLTGAMTATDAETLTVTATDDFEQTGDFVSDANIAVSLTADGSSASIRYNGILDVDHATSIELTAIGGGSVVIDDIVLLGVESGVDPDDIDTSITITSTGEDRAGVESVVTVSRINNGTVATTLDLITIVSDADGEVNLTTGGANLTVTEIDATDSLGTLVLNTSLVAAATEINLGAGTNTITTDASFADEINLAFEAGTDTINILENQTLVDVVTNFQAGDDGDVLSIDVSAVATGLDNANSDPLSDALVVSILESATGANAVVTANTNIIALTNTFADITAVFNAVTFAGADQTADGDTLLVAYSDGASTFIASITADGFGEFDAGANLIELVGVAVTDLTADNFAFV